MRKKNKKITEISFRDMKAYIKDQRYKHKKDISDFSELPSKMYTEMAPVFVVSTGRAGSELLVKLFKKSKAGTVFHEPEPRMFLGSKLAYEMGEDQIDARKVAFLNARFTLLRTAYLNDERYIETNNRTTFFMDAISEVFSNSKFIHIIRHPGGFVRSGIRRKYYTGNELDFGRIIPIKSNPVSQQWDSLSQLEKTAWLWNETNALIERVKSTLTKKRVFTIKSDELFKDPINFQKMGTFLGLSRLDLDTISAIIKKPVNKQKQGTIAPWQSWDKHEIDSLKKWTPLGRKYGFWSED